MFSVNKPTLIILTAGILFLLPFAAGAATLYLDPSEGGYGPGDSISVDIKIDIDGACVNTVETEVVFPPEYLKLAEFLTGESILNLWLERPDSDAINRANATGRLNFSGGIPGGYCGRIPGDPGTSNILGRAVFTVPGLIISESRPSSIEISLSPESRVLLNDGRGTSDRVILKQAAFTFLDTGSDSGQKWRAEVRADKEPPEPFMVELQKNPAMFEGRYYIIFNTTDKQSGIDHYEVLEIRPGEEVGVEPEQDLFDQLFGEKRPAPAWKTASIPYLLEDQSLLSIIRVKAVDNAGNERLAEYIPPAGGEAAGPAAQASSDVTWRFIFLGSGIFLSLVIILAVWIIIRRRRRTFDN